MRVFAVQSLNGRWEGDIVFTFYDKGSLESVRYPEVMNVSTLNTLATMHATNLELFEAFCQMLKKYIKVTEIVETSFEVFWKQYNQTGGSKIKAQMYWDGDKKTINKRGIGDADRVGIMQILPQYVQRYKGDQKKFQPLATTFLYERYFDTEIEKMEETKKKYMQTNILKQFPVKQELAAKTENTKVQEEMTEEEIIQMRLELGIKN